MASGDFCAPGEGVEMLLQVCGKQFPPCALTEEDLIQNPRFSKLLLSLSQHVDESGLSLTLAKEQAQAWSEVRHRKTAWLRYEILQRVIQELLVDYYVKAQDTNLTSEDKKFHEILPGKVAQTACMSACQHLSTSLMQMLLDSELKQISMGAVQQFNLDVIQCELFASSEPVPGFQGDTLQLAFIDLRQLLDLFMVWDWSTYLADYGQPASKYLRVNPHAALTLLEKMKDTMDAKALAHLKINIPCLWAKRSAFCTRRKTVTAVCYSLKSRTTAFSLGF